MMRGAWGTSGPPLKQRPLSLPASPTDPKFPQYPTDPKSLLSCRPVLPILSFLSVLQILRILHKCQHPTHSSIPSCPKNPTYWRALLGYPSGAAGGAVHGEGHPSVSSCVPCHAVCPSRSPAQGIMHTYERSLLVVDTGRLQPHV